MAFTDNSDLFGAIHEDGINKVVRHLMLQRPSLFNYGTERVLRNPDLLCIPIGTTPDVADRENSLITVEDPLPLLGTNSLAGLDFCVQLTKIELDLHPGNRITLPPELSPPLKAQRFAIRLSACAGLGCPAQRDLDNFLKELTANPRSRRDQRISDPITFPARNLRCFCLDLFVIGHFEMSGPLGRQRLLGKVDGLEIVEVRPQGLENNLECYLNLLIQLVILPRTSVAVEKLTFELLDGLPSISLFPSKTVPNNPAIEEDQIKVFVDFEVSS